MKTGLKMKNNKAKTGLVPLLIICWNTLYQNLVFRKIAEIVSDEDTALLIVYKDEQELKKIKYYLNKYLIPTQPIHFMAHSYDGIWIRDYCPFSTINDLNKIELIDFMYHKTKDNLFARAIAKYLKINVKTMPLNMQGGNLIINQNGIAICTDLILQQNNISKNTLFKILKTHLNISQLVVLKKLQNEATGHIDMLLKFANSSTLLATQLTENMSDYEVMTENIATLKAQIPSINIVQIPIATDNDSYEQLGNIFYSYTNAVVLNKSVMLPLYGEPTDELAFSIFQKVYPKHTIQGIFTKDIIQLKGALHCMTAQIVVERL